jgi:hypothetical protein
VCDCADFDLHTYKDFINLYISSILIGLYVFIYTLTFTFAHLQVAFAKINQTRHSGTMSRNITEGIVQKHNLGIKTLCSVSVTVTP